VARAVLFVALLPALAVAGDVAVGRGGQITRRSSLVVNEAERILVDGKKELPLDGYYLVEHDDGKLIWAPDLASRMRAYELLARDRRREEAVRLLKQAISGRNAKAARHLYASAQRDGFWGRAASSLEGRIEALEARSATPSPSGRAAAEEAARLPRLYPELLLARVKACGNDLALLRETLRVAPDLEEAKALLVELAPKDFPRGDARLWLDWTLDLESRGIGPLGDDAMPLMRARRFWRKDVFGLDADPIQLITPVTDTQVIGRCLAYGRLTAKALEELFKDFPARRKMRAPMTVLLFSSREEYQQKSGTQRRYENPADLEWTAGHYSPMEELSRFYWYKDPDSERRIAGTCVHELTHHWLAERNPAYSVAIARAGVPGYWIVEGFATFMQEGIYDVDAGTWNHFDARARSLDMVNSVDKRALIPWPRLFTLTDLDFEKISIDETTEYVRRWALGRRKVSPRRLFYEQGGAACQFLFHAEGGKYRRKLLEYVVAHYRARNDALSPETAFGMSGAELGKKVEEFAAAVAGGWRPE